MPAHMTGNAGPMKTLEIREGTGRRRQEIRRSIEAMHAASRRGLWRIILFLGISAALLPARGIDIYAAIPAPLLAIVGISPPPLLIHVVLVVFTFSAAVLAAAQKSGMGGSSLRFCIALSFYLFYAAAGVLEEFYPLVLLSGLLILLLEHFSCWSDLSRRIRCENERLHGSC